MPRRIINILLVSECGIGKSTLINAFANYLKYFNFETAENNRVVCVIPSSFTILDDNYEEQAIRIGLDSEHADYDSGTQTNQSYSFDINRNGWDSVRFIDTVGLGAAGGIEHDNKNITITLEYIKRFGKIHAICILLNPNNARSTVTFQYCVKHLLSRLDERASQNVVFVFTKTRGTFYQPGDTIVALRETLKTAKHNSPLINITLREDNVFSLDNEAFRYLAALNAGLILDGRDNYAESWNHSLRECFRLIDTIIERENLNTDISIPNQQLINDDDVPQYNTYAQQTKQSISTKSPLRYQAKKFKSNDEITAAPIYLDRFNSDEAFSNASNTEQRASVSNYDQQVTESTVLNILLLGETGIGKTTLINAFGNYVKYEDFRIAEASKFICTIPFELIVVDDENYEDHAIHIDSSNSDGIIVESANGGTRSYVFPLVNRDGINAVRFIDTPGIGDERGIDQDNIHIEDILRYIDRFEEIHAICILMKPNISRLTPTLNYCFKRLLFRFDKSASKNIMFVFTSTRSTFYKTGDTTIPLKEMLRDVEREFAEIPFNRDNVFCLDNEAFNYLAKMANGIQLQQEKEFIPESWFRSVRECYRLIDTLIDKKNSGEVIAKSSNANVYSLSIEEANRIVEQLTPPVVDILEFIHHNIIILKNHRNLLFSHVWEPKQLIQKYYIPVINLEVQPLDQPVFVCTSAKCCQLYKVFGIETYYYRQICGVPCHLHGSGTHQNNKNCQTIRNGELCQICSCDSQMHKLVHYRIITYEGKLILDDVSDKDINSNTVLEYKSKLEHLIKKREAQYKSEMNILIKTMAKLSYFLEHNTTAQRTDYFKEYVTSLINRNSFMERIFVLIRKFIEFLERNDFKQLLLRAYNREKDNLIVENICLTQAQLTQELLFLYELPKTGKILQKLHLKLTTNENKRTAYNIGNSYIPLDRESHQLKPNYNFRQALGSIRMIVNDFLYPCRNNDSSEGKSNNNKKNGNKYVRLFTSLMKKILVFSVYGTSFAIIVSFAIILYILEREFQGGMLYI